jgi:PAS domain S-box-containing protein
VWRRITFGLTPRIVALVALTALLTGGVVVYIGVDAGRAALRGQILRDAETQADLAAGMTSRDIKSAREPLTKIAGARYTREAMQAGKADEMRSVLVIAQASAQPGFQNVSIYDRDGELFSRAVETVPAANVALLEWFTAVKASRVPYVGLGLLNPVSGEPVVPIVAPVLDESGQFLGAVVATLSLGRVSHTLDLAEHERALSLKLVDRRQGGVVLAQGGLGGLLQPLEAGDELARALLTGERVARSTTARDGGKVLTAITPMSDLPWAVVVEQSSDSAFRSLTPLTRDTVVFGAAVILAGCVLSAVAALQITRPLERLKAAVLDVTRGRAGARLDFRQRGEIGDLGRAFDAMSESLQQRTNDLNEAIADLRAETAVRAQAEAELRAANDKMEMRVQERTADLAEANLALQASEQKFRHMVDGARDYALIMLDRHGRVTKWNQGAERLDGYSAEEAMGLAMEAFFNAGEIEARIPELLLESAEREGKAEYEGPRVRKDGSTFWGHVVLTAIRDESGELVGFSRLVRDITEKREAEEKLRQSNALFSGFVAMAADGIIVVDSTGAVTVTNKAAQEMFGYSEAEFQGLALEELLPAGIRSRHAEHRASYLAHPEPRSMGIDLRIAGLRRDGNEFDAEVSLTPLQIDGVLSVAATVTDVSERRRLERTVEQTLQELRRSNEELTQFAYVASHDLQEPLRMVSNYTQLLARRYKDRLDHEAEEFIDFAVEGARRMQLLINDLLEYSRVSTKGRDPVPVNTELTLNQVLTNLQMAIQECGARIERTPLPIVMADEAQVAQLLQNLIANALKFHGERAPIVAVGAERAGERWLFWVKDNGIGIDRQYFERIFVLFQRLHTRDRYEGTGMGLAICKRIVERHGGDIWVESAPGEGTTFFFTLASAIEPAGISDPNLHLIPEVA